MFDRICVWFNFHWWHVLIASLFSLSLLRLHLLSLLRLHLLFLIRLHLLFLLRLHLCPYQLLPAPLSPFFPAYHSPRRSSCCNSPFYCALPEMDSFQKRARQIHTDCLTICSSSGNIKYVFKIEHSKCWDWLMIWVVFSCLIHLWEYQSYPTLSRSQCFLWRNQWYFWHTWRINLNNPNKLQMAWFEDPPDHSNLLICTRNTSSPLAPHHMCRSSRGPVLMRIKL